jgi:RimJ/RimL family protein N-acetyltransferase
MESIPTPVLNPPLHQVPLLQTARLIMRGYKPSDFEQYVAMWADPKFYRYLTPRPMVEEEVWAMMLRSIGHWALMGYGFWAIEEKATGTFIGAVGFADPKRDITPKCHGIPEIGWVLAAHLHGQGYATEAVAAAIAWGDAYFGGVRTVCIIHPDNRASQRLAEKFGYRKYHRTLYKDEPIIMLERFGKE